jgi:ClpP class serine protease
MNRGVGIGLRHEEIEKIAQEADKYGPGQIIVLEIDSPGGLVSEGDKIHETFKKWKDRHRFVGWIREAISGAAFTALHCDEIIFMRVGSLGAITMFAGETAITGDRLRAWLDMCSQVAEMGGRNPIPVRAMITTPLLCSYDKDEATGKVTWYDTLQGKHILSNEKDNLVFNASNGVDSGFVDGVADTTDELAKVLQLPEWYEINDAGRRMAKEWQDTLEQCNREVPKLIASYGMKGGDAEVVIGSQMNVIRELIKWWDRCYNGMAYDLPQKGAAVPPKEDLERRLKDLSKQMADIKKQKRAAGSE